MLARIMCLAVMATLCLTASAQQPNPKEQAEARKMSGKFIAIQRLLQNPKEAEEFGLDSAKRRKIQIEIQKYTDAVQKASLGADGKFDMDAYKKTYKDFMASIDAELTPKQRTELTKRGEELLKNMYSGPQNSQKFTEMRRLQSMMSELQKLSYDTALAESIELTTEQRIEIREASQKMMQAMQSLQKEGQSFDMQGYNRLIEELVLEAQAILTMEQAEKLATNAKVSQLKTELGDVFAVVSGLARDFDLSDADTKKLSEEIVEARQDYYEKLANLREDTMERILRQLPAKHREEVREALGDQLKPNRMEMRGLPKKVKDKAKD